MIQGIMVLVGLVALAILFDRVGKRVCYETQERLIGGMILCIIAATLHFLVFFIANPIIYCQVSKLQAFHRQVKPAYEYAFDQTKGMDISAPQNPGQLVDAARVEQLKVASERLKELRDKVDWYNTTLYSLRRAKQHWFLRMYVADVPDDLQPIMLGEKK